MAAALSAFKSIPSRVSFHFRDIKHLLQSQRQCLNINKASPRYFASMVCQKSKIGGENLMSKHMDIDPTATPSDEKRNISVEHYLSEIGASLVKIRKQLDISRLSLDRVKEKVRILRDIGLKTDQDIGRVLSRRPTVLVLRDELLLGRIKALKTAGIEPDSLTHVVRQSPGVLTGKTEETLSKKIKFLQALAVKPKLSKSEVLHLLTKCPDIIATCSLDSLQDKLNFLEKILKFNQHQLRNILLKQPAILTFSKDSMKAKYRYCYEQLNASRTSIARCPRLFQCSLKRIQERHLFLQHVGRLKEDMAVDDYGLGVIVSPTDKYFAEKVALSTLEEFDSFRHSLSSDITFN